MLTIWYFSSVITTSQVMEMSRSADDYFPLLKELEQEKKKLRRAFAIEGSIALLIATYYYGPHLF